MLKRFFLDLVLFMVCTKLRFLWNYLKN